MEKRRLTAGAIALIFVALVVALIAALRWVGSNAHTINNGIGTVFGVLAFALVVAGAVVGAILLYRNRHHLLVRREAPAAQPPIHVYAQQLPAAGPGPAPALAPGQVPALAPGQAPGLPAGAPGPLVIYGLDHHQIGQIGDLLRTANPAAADTNHITGEGRADG